MKIKPYPKFEDVFHDDILLGIFYPICSVSDFDEDNTKLHFVSSNGIWMNEDIKTEFNTRDYTLFSLKNGKYHFNGNLELYSGFDTAKAIIKELIKDFVENGTNYLNDKFPQEEYIEHIKSTLKVEFEDDFDIDYYLGTFYEYSIKRLNYETNNKWEMFESLDEIPPFVHTKDSDEFKGAFEEIEINREYHFPKSIDIDKFDKIGKTIGYHYFSDGNDNYLLFNKAENKVLVVNYY